jgi:nucleoside transporter
MTPLTVRLGLMFGLQYIGMGAWIVPLGNYLGQTPAAGGLNLLPEQVAAIYTTVALGGLLAPPLAGLLADRYFAAQRVLAVLSLLSAVPLAGFAWYADAAQPLIAQQFPARAAADELYGTLWWLMLAHAVFSLPATALSTVIALTHLPEPSRQFGHVRVYGTFGWIAAGLVVGACQGEVSTLPVWIGVVSAVALGWYALTLPHTPPVGQNKTWGELLGWSASRLLFDPTFALLLVVVLLGTVWQSFYLVYGNRFLTDIQAGRPAAVQTLAQVAEIGLMVFLPALVTRCGLKGVMLIGLAAWAVRYGLFAISQVPAAVVALPLHGVSFVCFQIAATLFVERRAPTELRASAQSLLTFLSMGLGVAGGNWLAGAVVAGATSDGQIQWAHVWLIPFVGALATLLVFAVGFRQTEATPKNIVS